MARHAKKEENIAIIRSTKINKLKLTQNWYRWWN